MADVIRFLALAAALGLAAGMLLGGVALLLASPAHAEVLDCTPVPRLAAPPLRIEV